MIHVVIASGLAMVIAGCGQEEPPSPSAESLTVAFITCAADGAHVTSPVDVQPDGVHLIVNAPENLGVVVTGDPAMAMELGPGEFGPLGLDTSSGQAVSRIGPGDYTIGCRDSRTDTVLPVTAPLTIVDPGGLWVDDRITCLDRSVGIADYVEGAEGEHGDLVAALRRYVTGLQPNDLVTRAGYPATDSRKVRIVREGTVIAVATYEQSTPGNWLLSVFEKCGSAGIGG